MKTIFAADASTSKLQIYIAHKSFPFSMSDSILKFLVC